MDRDGEYWKREARKIERIARRYGVAPIASEPLSALVVRLVRSVQGAEPGALVTGPAGGYDGSRTDPVGPPWGVRS